METPPDKQVAFPLCARNRNKVARATLVAKYRNVFRVKQPAYDVVPATEFIGTTKIGNNDPAYRVTIVPFRAWVQRFVVGTGIGTWCANEMAAIILP